jgi:hypothetical protein
VLRLIALASLLALAGCPFHHDPTCNASPPDAGGVGGTNGAYAQLVAVDETFTLVDIHDGGTVPLMRAPQGGHIILLGARVMDTASCMPEATGLLRDTTTGAVIGQDRATLYLQASTGGWSEPSNALSSMPNVPVCPSGAATRAINGNAYTLELTLSDGGDTIASLTAVVTPTCSMNDDYCATECGPPH